MRRSLTVSHPHVCAKHTHALIATHTNTFAYNNFADDVARPPRDKSTRARDSGSDMHKTLGARRARVPLLAHVMTSFRGDAATTVQRSRCAVSPTRLAPHVCVCVCACMHVVEERPGFVYLYVVGIGQSQCTRPQKCSANMHWRLVIRAGCCLTLLPVSI